MSTNDNSSLDDIQNLEIDFLFSIFDNHNNKQNHSQLQYDKVTHSGSFTFHPKFIQPIKVYGPLTNIKLRNNCIANTSLINTSSNKCYYHLQYLPVIIMSFILPSNYPGNIPNVTIPQFNLSSIWLPLSILNKIEQKLIEIANYHLGETTLWSCIEFLQNEHFYYMLEEFTGNLTSLSFDLFKFYAEYTLELDLSIEDFCNLLLINNDDRIDIEFDESFIECNKVTGCNKMTCSYCHLFFCWLCLEPISNRQDPYSHFTNGTCYGQLWTENKTE
ncbi:E3 ubiquitin-protein ligase [Schistosoma japonicum]|nr:E3 ubiquitin-protein ligase [Schistosoma japonicum]KAH8872728.1 E3 ubiquitin-protein ligase [Schistosoma japonicum]